MCSQSLHMAWLIEEPESVPFVTQASEIFRGMDQLASPDRWVCVVDRQEAADIAADRESHHATDKQFSNSVFRFFI